MLSYNDIINYKFEKAGFGGGYRPEDVDKFTMRVATDFQKLEQEKQELEQKMMTLAEKVEEYREDEESLRAALLGAQKLGDSIIRESKQKSEMMLSAARMEADKLVDGARRQIDREQYALQKLQKEVSTFKNRLLILYKQHLELISAIPGQDVPVDAQEIIQNAQNPGRRPAGPPQGPMDAMDAPGEDGMPPQEGMPGEEAPLRRPPEEEMPPLEAPPREEPGMEEPLPPRDPQHESRFGELRFGEGYDLTRGG